MSTVFDTAFNVWSAELRNECIESGYMPNITFYYPLVNTVWGPYYQRQLTPAAAFEANYGVRGTLDRFSDCTHATRP